MNDMTATKPRVLLVYYSYTEQSRKVVEAMADVCRERGCDVRQAAIEFHGLTLRGAVLAVSLRHPYLDIFE